MTEIVPSIQALQQLLVGVATATTHECAVDSNSTLVVMVKKAGEGRSRAIKAEVLYIFPRNQTPIAVNTVAYRCEARIKQSFG